MNAIDDYETFLKRTERLLRITNGSFVGLIELEDSNSMIPFTKEIISKISKNVAIVTPDELLNIMREHIIAEKNFKDLFLLNCTFEENDKETLEKVFSIHALSYKKNIQIFYIKTKHQSFKFTEELIPIWHERDIVFFEDNNNVKIYSLEKLMQSELRSKANLPKPKL